MNTYKLIHIFTISSMLLFLSSNTKAQSDDYFKAYRSEWLQKAEKNMPSLARSIQKPLNIIEIRQNPEAFQGWEAISVSTADSLFTRPFNKTQPVMIDFGEHITGFFSCDVTPSAITPDSPLRLKITFGEVPAELATPFDPFPGGLNRSWLQDEIITVMHMPATIKISRRVSFRYLKIEVMGNPAYPFMISSMECEALTSAQYPPKPLPEKCNEMIREIDRVGLHTLRECMQTVFEDGPKRDQRLWIGDLYLQAMSNNYSFQQQDLTRRSLYLIAGLSHPNGYLHPCLYEKPTPHADSRLFLLEYALLFNVTLRDYLEATGDRETALSLWPVAKRQLDIIDTYLTDQGLMDFERANQQWWIFIDWRKELHKEVSLQGVSIFALEQSYHLARLLGKEDELKHLPMLIRKMKKAAHVNYFDKKSGLFKGLLNPQISYASQIWMILSGVASREEAEQALVALEQMEDACKPGTPYLYHYYIEALIESGLNTKAREKMIDYWGGMIQKGADTFWEAYDPEDDFLSPYNFFPINSYCHAWSCTPVYFIRKYPKIFQNRS